MWVSSQQCKFLHHILGITKDNFNTKLELLINSSFLMNLTEWRVKTINVDSKHFFERNVYSFPCCVLVNGLTLSSTVLLGPYERNESHFQRRNLHNAALKKINPAGTAIKHVPLLCEPREAANINLSAKFTWACTEKNVL